MIIGIRLSSSYNFLRRGNKASNLTSACSLTWNAIDIALWPKKIIIHTLLYVFMACTIPDVHRCCYLFRWIPNYNCYLRQKNLIWYYTLFFPLQFLAVRSYCGGNPISGCTYAYENSTLLVLYPTFNQSKCSVRCNSQIQIVIIVVDSYKKWIITLRTCSICFSSPLS